MRTLRPLVWLALVLLSTLPVVAAAQGSSFAALAVAPTSAELHVTLTCPEQAPAPVVTLDHAPARLLDPVTPTAAPPTLALVLEVSAPMGQPGTPHSTRLRDAVGRAEALLALAPLSTTVTLVTFDQAARVSQPLTTDLATVRAALATLVMTPTAPLAEPAPTALAAAIDLGFAQLHTAAAGPRALVVFTAGMPDLAPIAAPAENAVGMLIVGQGADQPSGATSAPGPLARAAEGLGAAYVAYHSVTIAALPTLNRTLDEHFTRLLTPGTRLYLRLATEGLAPGAHLVAVTGCGAPLVTAFTQPQGLSFGSLGLNVALVLVAGGVGAGVMARRSRRNALATQPLPLDTPTARLLAAAAITTARRATTPSVGPHLRAVVWDGRRRRVFPLAGRHWTVGRDPECTLCVEGEGIAPLHARISLAGGKLELADLGGTGNTRRGEHGQPLALGVPEPLAVGEVVLLGPTLRLTLESEAAPTEESS